MKYLAPFRYGSDAGSLLLSSKTDPAKNLSAALIDAMDAYEQTGFDRELCVRSKILNIHAQVCGFYLTNRSFACSHDRYLTETQLYIENHIGEDISPYEVADALHISYSHLSRLIRNAYGCTLGTLIIKTKINYAERLMTDASDAGITDIALRSGFNSASYFSKCFHRIKGMSPQKFRSMLNKRL